MQVITSREVVASRQQVFGVLADYHRRAALLPASFTDYAVTCGGQGAGTLVRYRLRAAGRARDCHMEVTEPARGRVLEEHDTRSGLWTRWSVNPGRAGPGRCRVYVETRWPDAGGVAGVLERALTPRRLAQIYNRVLDGLARQVAG